MDTEKKAKCLGYGAVDHKESLSFVSPIEWRDDTTLPSPLRDILKSWLEALDNLALDFVAALATPVFGIKEATLTTRADLPIAYRRVQTGMLDIAYYHNRQTVDVSPPVGHSTKEVNCVPHIDPGLLSISFLSTQDGLQLLDPATNTWFAGPVNTRPGEEDLGVIWLGEAAVKASKGQFKAGVHRVVYPSSPIPRATAWYEMCTVEQVNSLNKEQDEGTVAPPNIVDVKPLTLQPKQKRQIERHYGMPMTKSFKTSDTYRAFYSEDRTDEEKKRKGTK